MVYPSKDFFLLFRFLKMNLSLDKNHKFYHLNVFYFKFILFFYPILNNKSKKSEKPKRFS